MTKFSLIKFPPKIRVETKAILRKAASAHRSLAELKGLLSTIPNENILNETLTLREAKESSEIENIITTFDEVYQSSSIINQFVTAEAKEVHHYADALKIGFELVKERGLLTVNDILKVQQALIQNTAGFRKLPGTTITNDTTGEVVYIPPQDYDTIVALMRNLETFINDDDILDADPLVKMAIIHHRFESIHPFYDGNGRTGRIINILYLIQKELLDLPVLYLSRYVIKNKNLYYSLLQKVRDKNTWEEWILFMLQSVDETAIATISLIRNMKQLMQSYKEHIRLDLPKIYSQELLNNLFKYPYTKIEYLQRDLAKSRNTCISYLEQLVKAGLLIKQKKGRDNFYINQPLFDLLSDKKPSYKTMEQKREDIKDVLCKAIKERHLIRFYYASSGGKYWRKIEPYLLAIKQNGSIYFTGYEHFSKQRVKEKGNDRQGQYLLNKIDSSKFKVLKQTFGSIKIPEERIFGELPTVKVICRLAKR
jgi:Fic family protein